MSDPSSLNEQRADRAKETLEFYRMALGQRGPVNVDTLTDLLTDLLHWRRTHWHMDECAADPDTTVDGFMEDVGNAKFNFLAEADEVFPATGADLAIYEGLSDGYFNSIKPKETN